jgi:hypothetical protein
VRSQRTHNDLAALLRVLESLDPEEFAQVLFAERLHCASISHYAASFFFAFQVPDHLKTGLNNQRLSNLRAAAKTEEENAARLELIAGGGYGEAFAPYSDAQMDSILDPMRTRVGAILAENLVRFFFCACFFTLHNNNTPMAGLCWYYHKKRPRLRLRSCRVGDVAKSPPVCASCHTARRLIVQESPRS